MMGSPKKTNNLIGILLFDGAEEMDFVGPWEVLTAVVEGVRFVRDGNLVSAAGVMSGY